MKSEKEMIEAIEELRLRFAVEAAMSEESFKCVMVTSFLMALRWATEENWVEGNLVAEILAGRE